MIPVRFGVALAIKGRSGLFYGQLLNLAAHGLFCFYL